MSQTNCWLLEFVQICWIIPKICRKIINYSLLPISPDFSSASAKALDASDNRSPSRGYWRHWHERQTAPGRPNSGEFSIQSCTTRKLGSTKYSAKTCKNNQSDLPRCTKCRELELELLAPLLETVTSELLGPGTTRGGADQAVTGRDTGRGA